MRKFLSILLTLALIIGIFPPIAKADESTRQSMNQHMSNEYRLDDFFPQTVKGKPFNIVKVDTIIDNSGKEAYKFKVGQELKIPNYGEPWSFTQKFGVYRYAGYTPQGLPNGNPNHPFDDWAGGILETRNWISEPWRDKGVQQKIASKLGVSTDEIEDSFPVEMSMGIRDIPQIREKILWGLLLERYNGEYIVGKGPGQGINYPWEEKIMVYYPPTPDTWGRGTMWHYSKYDGKLYYFEVWIPNALPNSPDFFPTPEGSTEWKPQHKDPKYCAKTYTYEQGQTEITFPVNLFNQGEEAITDFKAVWFNSSKVNPKPWDSPVWEAKETDRHGNGNNPYIEKPVAHPNAGGTEENPITQPEPGIKLAKGESKIFEVTVPLPVPDYAGGMLAFKCNVDEKTPENELDQENNMMIIQFEPKGIDLAVQIMSRSTTQKLQKGLTLSYPINIVAKRKRIGNDDLSQIVTGDLTITSPTGTEKHTVSNMMPDFSQTFTIPFTVSGPGTYTVSAEIWPVGEDDLYPPDNTAEITITVVETADPYIEPLDDEIRTGLCG